MQLQDEMRKEMHFKKRKTRNRFINVILIGIAYEEMWKKKLKKKTCSFVCSCLLLLVIQKKNVQIKQVQCANKIPYLSIATQLLITNYACFVCMCSSLHFIYVWFSVLFLLKMKCKQREKKKCLFRCDMCVFCCCFCVSHKNDIHDYCHYWSIGGFCVFSYFYLLLFALNFRFYYIVPI